MSIVKVRPDTGVCFAANKMSTTAASHEKELSSADHDPEIAEYNGSDASTGGDIIANEIAADSKDMYRMGKDQQFKVRSCSQSEVRDLKADLVMFSVSSGCRP